jgi:hypothetical protein
VRPGGWRVGSRAGDDAAGADQRLPDAEAHSARWPSWPSEIGLEGPPRARLLGPQQRVVDVGRLKHDVLLSLVA